MAQVAIREHDAEKMFSLFTGIPYSGFLVEKEADFSAFQNIKNTQKFIIKPDQLFGKRGKYGLIGVNLDEAGVKDWWQSKSQKEVTIGAHTGVLSTFLVEPFVPHTQEYYVAVQTERDHDVIFFSTQGGIEVEEHWDSVQEIRIPLASP